MDKPAIDRSTIEHVATLSSISLTDAEAERMARELCAIVRYVEALREVDTSGVVIEDPAAPRAWRNDERVVGLSHDEALSQAPSASADGFGVPTFVTVAGSGAGSR
jgi:aspartyl-tRNA(Asn)/glutamyl-tRNA(Gln) amidotransferase subunit C